MLEMTDTFLHQGMHCRNDERLATVTFVLLALFATLSVLLIILGVRAA